MINQYIRHQDHPIIIGLAGRAGSGKTSVAESIVPKGSLETNKYGLKWDHIFYAIPLYELASAKKLIQGNNEASRRMYAIHDVLYEIFGGSPIGNVPHYQDLTKMVEQVFSMPIEPEGIKPRTFLQKAGDICRDFDPNCFVNWAIRKSYQIYKSNIKSFFAESKDDEDAIIPQVVILVSDVRFVNEAEAILKQPNGIVICFDASQETLDKRLMKRDGGLMDETQASHKSEQCIEDIKKIATFVIDTDNMNVEQQTLETLKQIGIKEEVNA